MTTGRRETEKPVRLIYLVRSWPRLSQTFISSEALALEAEGVDLRILAFTDPREAIVQPEIDLLRAPVSYLEELAPNTPRKVLLLHVRHLSQSPARYLRAFWCALIGGLVHRSGYSNYSGLRCLTFAAGVADALDKESPEQDNHLHAHFAHDPAFVALLVHILTGVSYTFTAHARDLYQTHPRALLKRAERALNVVTCCRANLEYLETVLPEPIWKDVKLIHHGVDSRTFRPTGAREARPVPKVVSVGRLVDKKGFADLIRACQVAAANGHDFTCWIYGEGPQEAELSSMISSTGLEGRVRLMGSLKQRELVDVYREADVFALTPYTTDDGDRDGIPNVVMEAMACGLPVLTTDAGGIAEVVADKRNGLLVASRNVGEIAAGLQALLRDGELRTRLGAAARETITRDFDLRIGVAKLITMFQAISESSAGRSNTFNHRVELAHSRRDGLAAEANAGGSEERSA